MTENAGIHTKRWGFAYFTTNHEFLTWQQWNPRYRTIDVQPWNIRQIEETYTPSLYTSGPVEYNGVFVCYEFFEEKGGDAS